MKAFKRIFSFLLVLSMIMSTLPGYTYAQETKSNVEENVKNSAENFLANVNGEIGTQGDSIQIPIDVEHEDPENIERYVVLIIDLSEKMKGKPFEMEKQTALKFCKSIMSASGKNYVSIIGMAKFEHPGFYTPAEKICRFTDDIKYLENSIDKLKEQKGRNNIHAALSYAWGMLGSIGKDGSESVAFSVKEPISTFEKDKPKKEKKIVRDIVLLSNGVPTDGKEPIIREDAYIDQIKINEFGKDAEEIAQKIKETGINIHTLGFYQNLLREKISFAKKMMTNIANGGYSYTVEDVDKIEFVFGGEDTDPIIIIPGIMGSRLYRVDDNKRIWEPGGSNFLIVDNNITGDLFVNEISNQQKKTLDEREYGAKNVYKNIVDKLCYRFSTRPVYVFSYDWRQSNSESAEKLNIAINKILAETGKKKVDIVAHSMGGLVTSSYYSKYGSDKIDKVITCGTPYEGSGKVFNVVMNWDILGENVLSSFDDFVDGLLGILGFSKEIKRSFNGVIELTPTQNYITKFKMSQDSSIYPYHNNLKLDYNKYIEMCKTIFNRTKYEHAQFFQSSILENGYNNLLNYENAYFLIGINHKTITSVRFYKRISNSDFTNESEQDLIEVRNRYYETDLGYETKGDGTVPFYSSSISEQIPKLDGRRWVAFNANHGEVKDLRICIDWISDILANGVSPIKGEIPKSEPYVVVRIACPVDVTTSKNGEELSSDVKKLKINSEYGRLDIVGKNDDIKMLCLDEDKDIKIKLNGTDTGTMNYTIRYFDEDNNLVDERTFKDIPVTKDTLIDTGIDRENKTVLNIDENGDGKVDKTISAYKNEIVNKDGKPVIFTKNIKLETPKTELKVGEEIDLSVSVEPKEANDKLKVKFKSSDEKIATVDENGKIKTLEVGKVTITVETENGAFKSSVELNILSDKVNTSDNKASKNNNEKTGDNPDVKTDLDNGNKQKQNSLVKTGLANSSGLTIISILSGLLVILASRKRKNSLMKHK